VTGKQVAWDARGVRELPSESPGKPGLRRLRGKRQAQQKEGRGNKHSTEGKYARGSNILDTCRGNQRTQTQKATL